MENEVDKQSARQTEVMFDGACPLCLREIAIYRKLKANEAISWVDVSACNFQPPAGMTKKQLLQRFHLITPDGDLLSGAEAFVFVWNRLPGWRWLGFFSRLPGMLFLMERFYRGFLIVRPTLQKLVIFFVAKH